MCHYKQYDSVTKGNIMTRIALIIVGSILTLIVSIIAFIGQNKKLANAASVLGAEFKNGTLSGTFKGRNYKIKTEFEFESKLHSQLKNEIQASVSLSKEYRGEFELIRGKSRHKQTKDRITTTDSRNRFSLVYSTSISFPIHLDQSIEQKIAVIFAKPRIIQNFSFLKPRLYLSGNSLVFEGQVAGATTFSKMLSKQQIEELLNLMILIADMIDK